MLYIQCIILCSSLYLSLCWWHHDLYLGIISHKCPQNFNWPTHSEITVWGFKRAVCFVGRVLKCSYSRWWVYKWRRKEAEALTVEGRWRRECRAERDRRKRGGGERIMREGMDRNTVWIVLMYVCACLVVPFTTNAVTLMPKGIHTFLS